ncbi:MAG: ABC transporter permease subunit [Chloroflexi bacterium]|nr:ABC transporter permease subunit [Chloroflexota bacterium]
MFVILRKELADYFTSIRCFVLFLLVVFASAAALYVAYEGIRGGGSKGFVFLRLFTTSGEVLPSFTTFVALLVPVVGIALGFDAINRERSDGTISRVLSQPIYRDSFINGKFMAGIATIFIMVLSTMLIVSGYGLSLIGVTPTTEEILRLLIFLIFTVVFGAFWMGLSMLFSILFRRIGTSLLVTIGAWLFFSIFILMIAPAVADAMVPLRDNSAAAEFVRNYDIQQGIMRLSPNTLFSEATLALLLPQVRSFGLVTTNLASYMIPNPLSMGQSAILIWPQLTSLLSLTLMVFAISYVVFMRQEIRST